MRAIVLEKFGGPDSLVYTDLPEPEPMPGHVVIEIKAFGLNHAEMHMRRGEWAEAAKVIGIVAAGRLRAKPSRVFRFEEIREAHRVMEANEGGGKMVVVHD